MNRNCPRTWIDLRLKNGNFKKFSLKKERFKLWSVAFKVQREVLQFTSFLYIFNFFELFLSSFAKLIWLHISFTNIKPTINIHVHWDIYVHMYKECVGACKFTHMWGHLRMYTSDWYQPLHPTKATEQPIEKNKIQILRYILNHYTLREWQITRVKSSISMFNLKLLFSMSLMCIPLI